MLSLPGFVNAHSHAFQRRLRGRNEGADFWAWRESMLAEAARVTVEEVRRDYAGVYREMRAAGYTAVGEFHYLGVAEARAAAEAADEAGIEIVLLHVAYARGGIERFRQESVAAYLAEVEELRAAGLNVGVAPHSVRACPSDWLEEIGRYAERDGLVLHIHADEQPLEVEQCCEEHGIRPIELLAETGCLGRRTTIVHGTHATDAELDLLSDSGSRICACPTTEANLGDGFVPVERIRCARDRPVHRHRLERPHRPVRGAARARGRRPADGAAAHGRPSRGAARDRHARRRVGARARRLGRDPDRHGTPLTGGRCALRGACGARLRVQRGRGRARLGIVPNGPITVPEGLGKP